MVTKVKYQISAEDKTEKAFKKIKNNITGVDKSFSLLKKGMLAAIPLVSIGALKGAMDNLSASVVISIDKLDDLGKTGRRLSLPLQELQQYHELAEASSISTSTFDTAFQRFSRRVGEAKMGTGELYKALQALNIELYNQDGSLRKNSALFDEFGAKVGSLEDDNVALSLAMKGVDTEGVKLIEMFRMQTSEQEKVLSKMDKMGGSYDANLIRKAEMYATEIGQIQTAQERLDVVADAGMAGMIRHWEMLKLNIMTARNEFYEFIGLMGVKRPDISDAGLADRLVLLNKNISEQKKLINLETDPARKTSLESQLQYAEKERNVLAEQVKLRIKALESEEKLSNLKNKEFKPDMSVFDKTSKSKGDDKPPVDLFGDELQKYNEQISHANNMLFEANDLYQEQIITLSELEYFQNKYGDAAESANKKAFGKNDELINWKQTAEMAISGVTGSLIDMATTGKNSFNEFAKSFLVNIAKMIMQAMVLKAISSTGWGAALGFSDGGVINNGKQTAFASGGVVSSPTLFPMANGMGLMGEAGPEAIMPLSRGADGKLGVTASNSGSQTVVQNINISPGNGDAQLAELVKTAAAQGYAQVLNDVKRNGPMRRTLGV